MREWLKALNEVHAWNSHIDTQHIHTYSCIHQERELLLRSLKSKLITLRLKLRQRTDSVIRYVNVYESVMHQGFAFSFPIGKSLAKAVHLSLISGLGNLKMHSLSVCKARAREINKRTINASDLGVKCNFHSVDVILAPFAKICPLNATYSLLVHCVWP